MMNTIEKNWFAKWALYSPDKVAISEVEMGREFTYAQIDTISTALAYDLLYKWGFEKGDRLMLLSDHRAELIFLFAAAQKTGIILVPVNYRLAPTEIAYLAENSGPKMIIYEEQFLLNISTIENDKSCDLLLMEELMDCSSKYNLSEPLVPLNFAIDDDHPLFILYTSGTTGFPKGAIYTHKMLFWNSINTTMSLEVSPNDNTIICMPTFHTGGWNVLLTPFLHRGAKVLLIRKFETDKILKLLESEKSELFMCVPTMLKMMMDSDLFDNVNLDALRYIIVGGEALPLAVITKWHNKGIMIRQGFGLTEVGPNLTSLHHLDAIKKQGSIGRPNFYVETKLVDENEQEVSANEIGEFCIKGNIVTTGYWKNEEATHQAITDGWFHTGDLMKKDDEGYLYVVDRKKSMYISGGENVYPAEIERVLRTNEFIEEAAVIGVKDDKWGEVGKAFYVKKRDSNISTEEIKIFCKKNLAKFKTPKHFVELKELPKNDSGKIDRKSLDST